MYKLVNAEKERRAMALAKKSGKTDEATVLAFYDKLGGLIKDKDGIVVPNGTFSLPKAERVVEAKVEEAPKEDKPKKTTKKK